MTPVKLLAGTFGAGLLALTAGAAGACTLQTVGELNVDLSRRAPIVDGEINGVKVKIMIDTGSRTSIIAEPAARALGMTAGTNPGGYVFGAGATYSIIPRSLKIGTLTATDSPPFPVGEPIFGEPDIAMLLGADFLNRFDVEFDLADNMIRLFHAEGCTTPQLVYWNKPYSQAALAPGGGFLAEASLNGKRVLAAIDTSASRSLVDAAAAAGAGEPIPPHPQFVVDTVGPTSREAWNDDFASVALGDESIAHARVEVADFARGGHGDAPSMLIGEDFLHAHRVMIDNRNHVMVFSYTGGPIFSTPVAAQP